MLVVCVPYGAKPKLQMEDISGTKSRLAELCAYGKQAGKPKDRSFLSQKGNGEGKFHSSRVVGIALNIPSFESRTLPAMSRCRRRWSLEKAKSLKACALSKTKVEKTVSELLRPICVIHHFFPRRRRRVWLESHARNPMSRVFLLGKGILCVPRNRIRQKTPLTMSLLRLALPAR